jgi:putative DNA primase/helicase
MAPPGRRPLTDLGNAERLSDHFGEFLRHHPSLGWIAWDGQRWKTDARAEIMAAAISTVRLIAQEAEGGEDEEGADEDVLKWAHKSESRGRISSMLGLAEHRLSIDVEALDADPYVVNCTNGTFDARTGQLHPHDSTRMLTHITKAAYNPEATCPRWHRFLERVQPNPETRNFLQRAAGYSLLGLSTEHVLLLCFGNGANGKTTFLEALHHAFGDYAQQAPTSTLMRQSSHAISNDIAMLRGARFVAATESEQDGRLAEATVKRLTGGDTLTARFLRKEFMQFKPSHTLWLATNYRPRVRGTDDGIWRRLAFIPWEVDIPPAEMDKHLPAILEAEADGILTWAIEGAKEMMKNGIGIPPAIIEATHQYRDEQDILGGFLTEYCFTGVDYSEANKALYAGYCEYARTEGEVPLSNKAFTAEMVKRGFERRRQEANGSRRWVNVGLRPPAG